MESITTGRWMEAKILKLRRNRKKEIFDIPLLARQDFSKNRFWPKKWKTFRLFVEGSLSFPELRWRELGFCRVCLLFVEVLFFPLPQLR